VNTSIFLDRSEDLPETKVKILKAGFSESKPFVSMDLMEEGGSSVTLYLKPDQALLFLVKLEDQLEAAIMEYANRDRKELVEVESA
jgi:hypothetical protein